MRMSIDEKDFIRKSGEKEPKSKYIIVSEGDKTEITYFKEIQHYKNEIGISNLVEVVPIENDENEHGQSHPLRKVENFKKFFKNENLEKLNYDKNIDKICFIVDRDVKNFKTDQYDEFLKLCEENGYFPYISNPTFELFLLMHSENFSSLDKKLLYDNKKVNKNKRYLETKLFELFGCNKRKINFKKFKNNINIAIKNEKNLCEDVNGLKTELGSNVGTLLDEMINRK